MANTKKDNFFNNMLTHVEYIGNKLPDPITFFIILCFLLIVISGICSSANVSAIHPGTGEILNVVNLFSKEGIRMIWSNTVSNFAGFVPLSVVLVAVIGTGVAEKGGLFSTLMCKFMVGKRSHPAIVTWVIIFIGINSNIAGDAGFIIVPPLAAIIFLSLRRHPFIGLFAGYASVACGFAACVMLGVADVVSYSFTETAARLIDLNYMSSPALNYYFLFLSCILLSITGTLVTEKIVAPRFEKQDISRYEYNHEENSQLNPMQNKGLKAAGISSLITLMILVIMSVGPDPILAEPQTGSLMSPLAPFMKGIIVSVSLMFFVPGAVYGFVSGKYKNDKDLFIDISIAFKDMAPYILLCFFCAQFTSFFNWSNLGAIMAIKSGALLSELNLSNIALLTGIIIISSIINIFIGSGSAKWAILAPFFVPMMMLLGLDPAVTQLAYRIGDSITNPLSPLFPYFPLILGFARKYEKDIGMGTIIANMIPFSLWFTIVWIIQLTIWVVLDLPLGPGGVILLN